MAIGLPAKSRMGTYLEHTAVGVLRASLPVCVLANDPRQLDAATRQIGRAGFPVIGASSAEEALQRVRDGVCRVVVADLKTLGVSCYAFLEKILQYDPAVCVIFVAELHSIESAIEAIDRGAPVLQDRQSTSLAEVRRTHIQYVLESCHGNRVRAARMLGIGRTSLYRFLKRSAKQASAARGGV